MLVLKRVIYLSLIVMILNAQSIFPHENDIQIIEGEEYVHTPFGLRLRECVHGVPSGTHIQKADDGSVYLINDKQNLFQRIPINERCSKKNSNNLSWLKPQGQASFYFPDQDTQTLQKYEANYLVPETPEETNNQKLYYSILTLGHYMDIDFPNAIYPLLTYHQGWYFSSWYEDSLGQSFNSTPLYGINSGDILYGSIGVQDDVATIISQDKDGEQSVLTLDNEGRFYGYFRITVNTEDLWGCSEFPTSNMEFFNISITDQNGVAAHLEWTFRQPYECNIRPFQSDDGTAVTFWHNFSTPSQA